jgi:hypothetical protein
MIAPHDHWTATIHGVEPLPPPPPPPPTQAELRDKVGYMGPRAGRTCRHCKHLSSNKAPPAAGDKPARPWCTRHGFPVALGASCITFDAS